MIKNIKDFPRLDLIQQYENGKEIVRLCDDGIKDMEKTILRLTVELDETPFEHEKHEIVKDIITCNVHLTVCEESKMALEAELKRLAPLYN